ncbi:MAG: alanine racemase [Pseudonocardiales bacterium]|nr:alanine racemase [Pseudonocardiales bacterium]
MRSAAVVDLEAVRVNVRALVASTPAAVMAVVKADGYGHGMVPCASAALDGGATWLGVAMLEEALDLRAAGFACPILAWLWTPDEVAALEQAVGQGVDVSVSARWALEIVQAAVAATGRVGRIHLKIDTGLSRNGSTAADWPALLTLAAAAEARGEVEIVGIWSHFAYADEPGHPTIAKQIARFIAAIEVAAGLGVHPQVRHIANSAATLTLPEAHFDLVRPGIAIYGLAPVAGDFGLVPAMSLRSHVALAKRLAAGEGVSYGHQYTTERPTTAVLVPLGYADGVPRSGTNRGPLAINGKRLTISGRVCMDQFVVDVGDLPVSAGDEVVLFGSGRDGEPTAQDWADAVDTIHYEIVTRVGARVPRVYLNADPAAIVSTL